MRTKRQPPPSIEEGFEAFYDEEAPWYLDALEADVDYEQDEDQE